LRDLIFDQSGLHVAVVNRDSRIELRDVTTAHDLGNEVEIGSGIRVEDRVVVNPPDGTRSASPVSPASRADRKPPKRSDAAKNRIESHIKTWMAGTRPAMRSPDRLHATGFIPLAKRLNLRT
jgi:hypothetical protein